MGTRVNSGLQGVTRSYRRLQGVTRCYRGLDGFTVGYRGLQGITENVFYQVEHPQILFLGLYCIKNKVDEISNF